MSIYYIFDFTRKLKGQPAMQRVRSFMGAIVAIALAAAMFPAVVSAEQRRNIDEALSMRAKRSGWSRVIVTLKPGAEAGHEIVKLGGRSKGMLKLINAMVVELPNGQIKRLAAHPAVARLDLDRPTTASMGRVANLVGARYAQWAYGYDGAGIGIAVIDSGVTGWHNDLTYLGSNSAVRTEGNQRVAAFVDFVNGATAPYDDYGHGTHVSGIIAGNGFDSNGGRAGIAPSSHLVSLKVLDAAGRGVTSQVIAAIEYAITNRAAHNIRVINLSVGAAVLASYNDDPLTLAAKRAVEAGIVVVAAAGNLGRDAAGLPQYGGITAPGNAPWVLTVGASSHAGTLNRLDDTHASYSSRGPTRYDFAAKPDLLAPGTGVVSLAAADSTFYTSKSSFLLSGTATTTTMPYLSLSGTSMAAPVAAGTVALMLQANPNLTPNLVKAILQYTAQVAPGVDYLTQGGGFLNTKGAVDLARYFATATDGSRYPTNMSWSRAINWGNRRLVRGALSPFGSAWSTSVTWGASHDATGANVVWGTECPDTECFNVVWGTSTTDGDNVVWGTSDSGDNVVWGTEGDGENVVWGTDGDGDNVVWGTACEGDDCFNVVWGTDCEGDDCYNVVWGTECDPNVESCDGDNVVWGTDCDPIVESCDGDNVVWGTSGDGTNIVWSTTTRSFMNLYVVMFGDIRDEWSWQALFEPPEILDAYYDLLYDYYVNYYLPLIESTETTTETTTTDTTTTTTDTTTTTIGGTF